MPPKLSAAQIDTTLKDLHMYVQSNAAKLDSTTGDSLVRVLSSHNRQCVDAGQFYSFLYKHESKLSSSQQTRVLEIFDLLTEAGATQEQQQAKARRERTSPPPKESTAGSPPDPGEQQHAAEFSHPTKACSSDFAHEQKQTVEETESEDFITEDEDEGDKLGTLYDLDEWLSKRARLLEERSAIHCELRDASSSEYES